MRKRLATWTIVFLVAVSWGCEPEESDTEAQPNPDDSPVVDDSSGDEGAEAQAAPDESLQDPGDEDEPSGEVEAPVESEGFEYPGFDLDELDDDGRRQLADLARSELCPCPDSVISLHECMQGDDRCEEADELAGSLVDAVADGAEPEEAFDQVARERADQVERHDFSLDDSPMKGSADADVIIVEFADFQCPHCQTAAAAMDEVAERFGDDVGIYFKHFPLGSPTSDQASRAAIAAHQQGRFWPMHELLFDHQRQLDRSMIERFARQLGLNFDRFREDMEDDDLQVEIARDRHEGLAAGVQGTPAIFINGQRYQGGISGPAIQAHIQAQLEQ